MRGGSGRQASRAAARRSPRALPTPRHPAPLPHPRPLQRSNPYAEELKATAKYIAQRGRGILASDESNATTGKRLESVGVENTPDNRRDWRQLLYTAPGLGQYISGAIMFDGEGGWEVCVGGGGGGPGAGRVRLRAARAVGWEQQQRGHAAAAPCAAGCERPTRPPPTHPPTHHPPDWCRDALPKGA